MNALERMSAQAARKVLNEAFGKLNDLSYSLQHRMSVYSDRVNGATEEQRKVYCEGVGNSLPSIMSDSVGRIEKALSELNEVNNWLICMEDAK